MAKTMEKDLKQLAISLFEIDAVKFGDFITKVGLKTPVYIDLRVIISFPKILNQISSILWKLHDDSQYIDQICGVPYTALPIASIISVESDVPMLIRRKEAKSYGTKKLIEGKFQAGDTCIIIEDVVTSGSSILETARDLKNEGLDVLEALVIMDREQGGKKNVENNGITMKSLYTLNKFMEYLLEAGKVDQKTVDHVTDYLSKTAAFVEPLAAEKNLETVQNRLKIDFTSRSKLAKNPLAAKLLKLMDSKETTLCLAADLTQSRLILDLATIAGPHIAVLKIHADIIEDFDQNFVNELKHLSSKHQFFIMEDRKFGDIGNTVALQYSRGIHKIVEWADFITAHPVAGPGILDGLASTLDAAVGDRGIFLISQMSSKGALTTDNYIKESIALGAKSELVAGHVCQSDVFSNPGLIQLTPGVRLAKAADNLGQQYNTPEAVVNAGADLVVVGRGITESSNQSEAIDQYKKQLWSAYRSRINVN